jgi:tetratricopeptide (TPR) repeat protein
LFYLGMIELARGNDDSAKDYLERALQKERRVSILSNMAYLLIRGKFFKEAIDLLEEAQKIEPDNSMVDLNLSIARYNLGELDKAARGFQHVLSISGDLITPYLYLSLISVKKGDVKTAIDLLCSGVERFPDSAAFKNNLALLHESIEENETAESLYLEALLLQPADNVLLKNIANLYYRLGLYGGALDYYEQIPENDRDARTSIRLGRVYLLTGDGNSALKQWKRAKVLEPQNDILRQEIEILSDLVSV